MSEETRMRLIVGIVLAIFFAPIIIDFVRQFSEYSGSSSKDSTQNFYFESFDAEYDLSKNNQGVSLKVKEKLVAFFPNQHINHGIDRCIPRSYKGKHVLALQDDSPTLITVDGGPYLIKSEHINSDSSYTTYYSGEDICYRIGNAKEYVFGRHEYVIEYEYQNMIISPADSRFEELYWNTNGTNWKQKFNKLSATVTISDDLLNNLSTSSSCYVGRTGIKGIWRCKTTKLANGYRFETDKLGAGENLTFDLGFKSGTFPAESIIYQEYNFIYLIVLAIVILILLIPIIIYLIKFNKTKPIRAILKEPYPVQYLPPRYNIAEAARLYYYHEDLKSRDFVATLIDLVVKNKIQLRRSPSDDDEYFFKYDELPIGHGHYPDYAHLSDQELEVLEIICGGKVPEPSVEHAIIDKKLNREQKESIKGIVASFRARTISSLVKNDFASSYEDPKKPKFSPHALLEYLVNILLIPLYLFTPVGIIVAIIAIGAYFGISYLLAETIEPSDILFGRTIIPLLIITLIIATVFLCRYLSNYKKELSILTDKGAREINYLRGLKNYMMLAEADRLKFLQSVHGADVSPKGILHLYERLLPYAVIFGIEKSWFNELHKYYSMAEINDSVMESLDFSMLDYIGSSTSSIGNMAASSIAGAAVGSAISSFADHLGSFDGGGFSGGGGGGGGGGSSGGGGGGGGGGGW